MENIEPLTRDLPDPASAERFIAEFSQRHPSEARRLAKDKSLFSDLLSVASYSPLLASTVLQNPEYIRWLGRERRDQKVREKDELLESLARFALTHTQIPPAVMLSRFRRRELIRIFLKDIRGLGTIAELTEEISNLADAILEYALQVSRQELDNRFGMPLQIDGHGKSARAEFCVIALGKLGSKELNYSSDIDLLFVYSSDGTTSGQGAKGKVSNKQYFVKLAESVSKLVSDPTGEGGAYRVDHRLRPHGRVGSLAVSLQEAKSYYRDSAQLWEKQVLIRSRNAAGDGGLFQDFYKAIEPYVFSAEETVENALENVLRSKQKIDLEKIRRSGFDVKLGVGGIREIEFIAQALQLAYGSEDRWLRAPHTLISLSRLADRGLLSEKEFTRLHQAYVFLRRVEHRVQMEHGLQTHLVPADEDRRGLLAARMGLSGAEELISELNRHTSNVSSIFKRFFDRTEYAEIGDPRKGKPRKRPKTAAPPDFSPDPEVLEGLPPEKIEVLNLLDRFARPFAPLLRSGAVGVEEIPSCGSNVAANDPHSAMMSAACDPAGDYAARLAGLRREWSRQMLAIVIADVCGTVGLGKAKSMQTELAEASIAAAEAVAALRLKDLFGESDPKPTWNIIGLGKLGGGGMDYHSDLDLLLVYDDASRPPAEGRTHGEFYSKAVEIFVTALSSLTREGSLYKVDLRLRPDGNSGATSIGVSTLYDYFRERSVPWEWLAYVKARSVLSTGGFGGEVEHELRRIIHERAAEIPAEELRNEAWRIRHRLETEKSGGTRGKSIDLKYGEGGLQDVYFAIRYLQLATGLADDEKDRSTGHTLQRLLDAGSLSEPNFEALSEGYRFLSELDHNIRLTVGRSTLVPLGNVPVLDLIAERMSFGSHRKVLEDLASHRLAVREAFESILKPR
ncbi:MAG: hypothetical protein IPM63_01030 [Acidobacteriota bacterium]|nr:MAG: hypothetical protein IPM63_01030 [Acidobacteriota bacterium]